MKNYNFEWDEELEVAKFIRFVIVIKNDYAENEYFEVLYCPYGKSKLIHKEFTCFEKAKVFIEKLKKERFKK